MTPKNNPEIKSGGATINFEELLRDVECPKNFQCYKSDFSKVGRVKADEYFLECLEKSAEKCEFSLPCVDKFYCLCPVRIHIANKLNI